MMKQSSKNQQQHCLRASYGRGMERYGHGMVRRCVAWHGEGCAWHGDVGLGGEVIIDSILYVNLIITLLNKKRLIVCKKRNF